MKFRLSLVPSSAPAPARTYQERKVSGECVYRGCPEPCQDGHLMCETHAGKHRERNRKHMRIARKLRRVQMRLWR